MLKRYDVGFLGNLSLVTPCFLEKLLNLSYWNLYLEPTQVVKKRILR